jgi:acetyltransferase-like isoleucine patch superfamily enzyme
VAGSGGFNSPASATTCWHLIESTPSVGGCKIRLLPVSGGAIRPNRCGRGALRPTARASALRRRRLFARYNASDPADSTGRAALLRELLGYAGPDAAIEPPFYCDYGTQITLGAGVFVNFGAVFLDPAQITIGEQSQLGPYVQLLTADHPRDAAHARLGRNRLIPSTLARGSGLAVA